MTPDPGAFAYCLKCGMEFDIVLENLLPCENCEALPSEAIGVETNLLCEIYEFCEKECAHPLLAFGYCSFELSGINHYSRKLTGGNFQDARIEVGQRINHIRPNILRQDPKCHRCNKYLLGHPQGKTVCRCCWVEEKRVWNSEPVSNLEM